MKCSECGNVGPCPQCEPDKFTGLMEPTAPREVADRLAEAWEIVLSADQTIEMGQWMDNSADVAKARARKAKALIDAKAALAEYRKAVSGG